MGIVETPLASFELSTFDECRVEQNSDGTIHLHMDGLRIEFSKTEFAEFAAVIERGNTELHELKFDDDAH